MQLLLLHRSTFNCCSSTGHKSLLPDPHFLFCVHLEICKHSLLAFSLLKDASSSKPPRLHEALSSHLATAAPPPGPHSTARRNSHAGPQPRATSAAAAHLPRARTPARRPTSRRRDHRHQHRPQL
nr:unnamed protein product [Digitaria exilis]